MRKLGWLCGVLAVVGCDPKDEGPSNDDGAEDESSSSDDGHPPYVDDDPGDEDPEPEPEPHDTEADTEPVPEPDTETDTDPQPEPETCVRDDSRACEGGTQYCKSDETWGACITEPQCELDDQRSCGVCDGAGEEGESGESGCEEFYEECDLDSDGTPRWACDIDPKWCDCSTPLVLSFDGAEPQLDEAPVSAFDFDVNGGCTTTDWPATSTPWLALDRDEDGAILDGRELFGSGTRLASGRRAQHGFAALAELDDDHDGRITKKDTRFADLVLWFDHDADKRGIATELEPLANHRVLAIELGYTNARQCDERGNCGIERASFTFVDRTGNVQHGEVVDIHLACH